NNVIPIARGTAARLLQEADGYKAEVVQRAAGDTKRFDQVLVEYQKAPGVTRERLYLDAMQTVLASSSKVLVDQKTGSLLYLPLDKLIQQSARAPATGTPDVTVSPPRAVPPSDGSMSLDSSRSREALRNREGR
ncbi:MAG TPA: protease modulator HflK, partial [Casimicrobiaceae bacterium]|nr:protease modulator HflK [Casimicrobiaceae bacterium]